MQICLYLLDGYSPLYVFSHNSRDQKLLFFKYQLRSGVTTYKWFSEEDESVILEAELHGAFYFFNNWTWYLKV